MKIVKQVIRKIDKTSNYTNTGFVTAKYVDSSMELGCVYVLRIWLTRQIAGQPNSEI